MIKMAKKEPSLQDCVDRFLDQIVNKGGYKSFVRENNILYGRNKNNVRMFIRIDTTLWNALPEDFHKCTRELNLSDPEDRVILARFKCCEKLDGAEWIHLDDEKFQQNEMFEFDLGCPFKLEFNSKIFPIRFKKDDCNNFYYKIDIENGWFMIKKDYVGLVPDGGFTIIRAFHLLSNKKVEDK